MSIQIIFTLDSKANDIQKGGSFDAPVAIKHPNMLVNQGDGTSSSYDGDHPVSVSQEEQIHIWLEDVDRKPSILIAPVRFIAHTWQGEGDANAKVFVTGTPSNPEKQINVLGDDKPLTIPSFMEKHLDEYGFDYAATQPIWSDDSSPFLEYWHDGGVMAGQDGKATTPRIHNPYVTFAMGDSNGTLSYGLEFVVYDKGNCRGYFWFDPYIKVTS